MLKPTKIIKYINRLRDMRRWAREHDDPKMYNMVNDEIQYWKKILVLLVVLLVVLLSVSLAAKDKKEKAFVSMPGHKHSISKQTKALIIGSTIGGTGMLVYSLFHKQGCPSMIDGFPYNGYGHPCPYECTKNGCEWPGGK